MLKRLQWTFTTESKDINGLLSVEKVSPRFTKIAVG
jgi:hypothetical protein